MSDRTPGKHALLNFTLSMLKIHIVFMAAISMHAVFVIRNIVEKEQSVKLIELFA